MIHLGNVCKIDGTKIPEVDCITFGSPCQDLSVAGKRDGLDGERSGLFIEAIRIIKEMRKASEERLFGLYGADYDRRMVKPRFAIWENVPGAFSSKKGDDFRVVLEELCNIEGECVSIPKPKKWEKSGCIVGNGWSVAWRTMDAQYYGIPQRRKRITVILDCGGECAGKILFEQDGVSRDSEPSIKTWKGIARNPEECADGSAECGHDYTLKLRHTGSDTRGGRCRSISADGQKCDIVM